MTDNAKVTISAGKDEHALKAVSLFINYTDTRNISKRDLFADIVGKVLGYCESNDVDVNAFLDEAIKNAGKVKPSVEREKPTDAKIIAFVESVMESNRQATTDIDKVAITMGYLRNTGNFNFWTTKRFLESYQDMIDQHHNEIGIDEKAVKSWNTKQTKLKKAIAESETTA